MSPIEKHVRESIAKMEKHCLALPWEDRTAYSDWLAQTFFYVRHATRVLAKAAYKCRLEEEGLHKKLLHGINEEKNHETMATSDMNLCGHEISDFYEYPETSAYYQTLYHAIDYHGPFALLGYFVTLEGLGAVGSEKLYGRVIGTHREEAATFLKVHAHLDAGHFREGIDLLESLPPEKLKLVVEMIDVSSVLYCNMIDRVTKEAKKRSLPVAA